LSFSIRQESRSLCLENYEKSCIPDEAWIPSHTCYIKSRHCRNKLIFLYGFGIELLFAENQMKIRYFLIWSNPAINKRKAHKILLYSDVVFLSLYAQCKFHKDLSFLSIKLSDMNFFLTCLRLNRKCGCHYSKFWSLQQVILTSCNIILWQSCDIDYQLNTDHVIVNWFLCISYAL